MSKAIIDLGTGEIIKELPQASLKTKEEHLKDKDLDQIKIPWDTKMFSKLFINVDLPDYSKESYLIYWLKLSKKVAYGSNIISNKNRGNDNYTSLLDCEIMKYLDISESTWFRFIKESMNRGIIAKDTIEVNGFVRTQYVLNPIYCFNGSNLNYYTFELFKYDSNFQRGLNQNQIDIYNFISKHKYNKEEDSFLPNIGSSKGLDKKYFASKDKKLF